MSAHTRARNIVATQRWFEQRLRAAEELWRLGYTGESYFVLRDGLRRVSDALSGTEAIAGAIGAEIVRLLEDSRSLEDVAGPAGYTRDHALWLDRARLLSARLSRALPGRERRALERRSLAIAAALFFSVLALAAWLIHDHRAKAFASTEYSPQYRARYATDGLEATEWLLPDATLGYLDVAFARRRPVHSVTIKNAHNRYYMDRAARRLRVVVFDDKRAVETTEVSFDKIQDDPPLKVVPLSGKPATRVRLEVLEYFGLGAGLAEVKVE